MEHDPFDLVGQEKADVKRAEKAKVQARIEQDDMKWLMKSRQGRRIVWNLLQRCGIYRSSFTGNNETFFREGMRNVGLALIAQIHTACPEQYTLMVQEQTDGPTSSSSSTGASS